MIRWVEDHVAEDEAEADDVEVDDAKRKERFYAVENDDFERDRSQDQGLHSASPHHRNKFQFCTRAMS